MILQVITLHDYAGIIAIEIFEVKVPKGLLPRHYGTNTYAPLIIPTTLFLEYNFLCNIFCQKYCIGFPYPHTFGKIFFSKKYYKSMICTGNLILEIMLLEYLNINSLQNQKKLSTPRSLHFDTNNYLHEGKLILIILSILE